MVVWWWWCGFLTDYNTTLRLHWVTLGCGNFSSSLKHGGGNVWNYNNLNHKVNSLLVFKLPTLVVVLATSHLVPFFTVLLNVLFITFISVLPTGIHYVTSLHSATKIMQSHKLISN